MSNHGFTQKSFDFLEDLAANNERDWFQAHKDDFQTYVEAPFLDLLEDLSARLQDSNIPIKGSKKTMFRMNRDVRFSKDKSPYKTSIAAVLTPSGTKKESGGLLYVHMDRSGGFAGTGWYNLSPKALGPFRDAMVDDPDAFSQVRKRFPTQAAHCRPTTA